MHSTNLIIAETLTDYQNASQLLHTTDTATRLPLDSAASAQDDYSYIPILNTEWVYDTHTNYRLCAYEPY